MWSNDGETVHCDFCGKAGTSHIYKIPLSGKPMLRGISIFDGHRMARFEVCSKCFPAMRGWLKNRMKPKAYEKSKLEQIRDAERFGEYLEIDPDDPAYNLPCQGKLDGGTCVETPSVKRIQELRHCASCAEKFEAAIHKVTKS
jgi:hypothetical protein